MKIKKIIYRNRRDFSAIFICENCNHESRKTGYDDEYFHNTVIPNMKCEKCNKSAIELNIKIEPLTPIYKKNEII